jgi:hypothetical protein
MIFVSLLLLLLMLVAAMLLVAVLLLLVRVLFCSQFICFFLFLFLV